MYFTFIALLKIIPVHTHMAKSILQCLNKMSNFWLAITFDICQLVRRSGKIRHHSITDSLSNISATNYQNLFTYVTRKIYSKLKVGCFGETKCEVWIFVRNYLLCYSCNLDMQQTHANSMI